MRFIRDNFIKHGAWLSYEVNTKERDRFVARFRYNRSRMGRFITFLIKNFEVEEYFELLEVQKLSPVKILEKKGFDPFSKRQHEELEKRKLELIKKA